MEKFSINIPKEVADKSFGLTPWGISFLMGETINHLERHHRIYIPELTDIREPYVDLVFSYLENVDAIVQSQYATFLNSYIDIYDEVTSQWMGMAIVQENRLTGFYRRPGHSDVTLIANRFNSILNEVISSAMEDGPNYLLSVGISTWSWLGIALVTTENALHISPAIPLYDVKTRGITYTKDISPIVKDIVTPDSLLDWLLLMPEDLLLARVLDNIDSLNIDILKRFFYQSYDATYNFRSPVNYISENQSEEEKLMNSLTLAMVTRADAATRGRTHHNWHDLLSILRRKVDVSNMVQAIDVDVDNLRRILNAECKAGTYMRDRLYSYRNVQLAKIDTSRLTEHPVTDMVVVAEGLADEGYEEYHLENAPMVSFGSGRYCTRVIDSHSG